MKKIWKVWTVILVVAATVLLTISTQYSKKEEISTDSYQYLIGVSLPNVIEPWLNNFVDVFTEKVSQDKKINVIPIYIEVDDGIRLERALKREKEQENPKYEELCRRFLADSQDFSEEKIEESGIEKRFQNINLDDCVKEIIEYIKNR